MEVKQQLTWWIRILEHVLNSQLFLLRTANKASEIKKVRQTHNTRKERTEAESVYCLDQNSSFWCVYFQIKKKKKYIYISLDFHTELFLSQKKIFISFLFSLSTGELRTGLQQPVSLSEWRLLWPCDWQVFVPPWGARLALRGWFVYTHSYRRMQPPGSSLLATPSTWI